MSTPKTEPRLQRRDSTLVLTGRLDAAGVAGMRVTRTDVEGVTAIDIGGVEALDSTGVALVADLVSRCGGSGQARPSVEGRPPGLEELCRAYRINPDFSDFP